MTPTRAREGPDRLAARTAGLAAAAVAAITALVFWPCLRGAILAYDDGLFLLPSRVAPTWAALRDVLARPYAGNYVPAASLSFTLDTALWDGRAWGYHLTSVAFHAFNAALLFALILELLGAGRPRKADGAAAAFGALFFALHPLRVESVAWIAERRDVLCGFFSLLALLLWTRAARPGERLGARHRAGALAAFLLALLSKSSAAPLPLAFALLDVWPLRRLPASPREWTAPSARAEWGRLAPFFLLSAAIAAVTLAAQRGFGAVETFARVPLAKRAAQAALGLAFYIGQTLWPAGLALHERHWAAVLPAACLGAAAVAAAAAAAYARPRLRAPLAAVLGCHSLMLAPVLGLVAFGPALVADRYSYLPGFAVAALAALGYRALARDRARTAAAIGALILAALASATRPQIGMWRDDVALWRAALRSDPLSWGAHLNLAKALEDAGRDGEALLTLDEQLRLYPDTPWARAERDALAARAGGAPRDLARFHEELGREFTARGEASKAAWHYRKALELLPDSQALRAELEAADAAAERAGR